MRSGPRNHSCPATRGPMTCELCERDVTRLSSHHLVPKLKGGAKGPRASPCATCHRQVHALFREGTLAARLSSIDQLRAEPEMAGYLAWVRNRPGGASFKVRRWKGRY